MSRQSSPAQWWSTARPKQAHQGRRRHGLPESGGDEAERNLSMPTEIVLGWEQMGRERLGMGLQPSPGLRQRRLQRGECHSEIPNYFSVIGDQIVRKPRYAYLHKLVPPVGGGSKVREITGNLATDRHEIVRSDGVITRDVIDSSVGGRRADQTDKGCHKIVHVEKVNMGIESCTQENG